MSVGNETKTVVSVAEMARMVGLSRSRFYQLIGTAFPRPERQEETERPIYTEEQQAICLEVRRRNCGVDGKPILFYARRPITSARPKPLKPKLEPKNKDVAALVEGLNALGLATATGSQVQTITDELYPNGTEGIDQGEVLRAVFLHLKRQNSANNVRR
jgi:hypothetical protein